MKRVLSLSTTGLFVLGLAMVPLSANADQATVGGKTATSVTTTPAAPVTTSSAATQGKTTTATDMHGASVAVKKDDTKTTVSPSTTAPVTSGTVAKTPGKGAS